MDSYSLFSMLETKSIFAAPYGPIKKENLKSKENMFDFPSRK